MYAQVWGGRILGKAGGLPISSDSLRDEGLRWPGFEQPITSSVARSLGFTEFFYVNDAVLGAYEGRPEYQLSPESGSVTFGTQWSVSGHRLGRDLIRIDPKKLYEAAPATVIRHWHAFAVAPISLSDCAEKQNEPNIARRAKRLTYAMVRVGEALAQLASSPHLSIMPQEFVGLKRDRLDYAGWWANESAEVIARHAPLTMVIDTFLDRCMSLNKLIVENISEAKLRVVLQAIGVPAGPIAAFRNLKLLDRMVCLAQIARRSGLSLVTDGQIVWERLENEGTVPPQPIAHLFVLYDMRILKGHKSNDLTKKLQEKLEYFGLESAQRTEGYGSILDQVYDLLAIQLDKIACKIEYVAQ